MTKIFAITLLASLLVAAAHAQQSVQVGNIASVQVAGDGSTSVKAPGTNVGVQAKAAGITSTKTVQSAPVTTTTVATKRVESGIAASSKTKLAVAGSAPQTNVAVTAPGTVVASHAGATTVKAPGVAVDVNVAKTGQVSKNVNTAPVKTATKTVTKAAPVTTTRKQVTTGVSATKSAEKSVTVSAGTNVGVTAPGTNVAVNGQASTVGVTAPGTNVAANAAVTSVRSPGAAVDVVQTGQGQPVTDVQTVAGVNVQNSAAGTIVSGIPFVGTVFAPGGRKMLRVF